MLRFQQIKRSRQRPRCRAVTVACQGATQDFNRATVLKKQRSGHRGITSIGIDRGAVLAGVQEYLGKPAILKAAYAGRVPNAAVLEVE
jgi:hypothetical protein